MDAETNSKINSYNGKDCAHKNTELFIRTHKEGPEFPVMHCALDRGLTLHERANTGNYQGKEHEG